MHLPGPLRAAVGLVATAAAEARHLPDRAIELPMLAVSSALQASLRAQQRYARLAARGDAVLNRRPDTDEPPPWATFDEPVSADELRKTALAQLDNLADGATTSRMFEELFGVGNPAAPDNDDAPTPITKASNRPQKKTTTAKSATTKSGRTKPTVTSTAKPTAKPTAKKPVAKSSDPAKGKSVSKPRHVAPSKFDDAGDA
ncbi:MAG: hypothetical protein M3Y06_10905 [Actinomycetota bacterium]|nr:hypothetical protein [Actinomycetota bacterium]